MSARQPRVHRPPGGFAKLAEVERERNEAWANVERKRDALAEALTALREALELLREARGLGVNRPVLIGSMTHPEWCARADALLGDK